jgi:hypothetical protein
MERERERVKWSGIKGVLEIWQYLLIHFVICLHPYDKF